MRWRFADLPVRTKFMITLGIPVLGMVLLIGKQVDSSLKRLQVMDYVNEQSALIGQFANVIHELQRESAMSVGYLTGKPVTSLKLNVQQQKTNAAITDLRDPTHPDDPKVVGGLPFDGLNILRNRVMDKRIDPIAAGRAFGAMDQRLLDEVGRIVRTGLDSETQSWMYAHQRLLNAKQALCMVRDRLSIGSRGVMSESDQGEINDLISQYETNLLLFERDAQPEVLSAYRELFQGPDVNFLRALIGTVKERRTADPLGIAPRQWWELSLQALEKMKLVEDRSLGVIQDSTAANSRSAEFRLLIVLAALIGVVGAVTIMGFVILRGVRNTVNEVSQAARSLALGDISGKVPVNSSDEIGQMALSFNGMIDNIRSQASSAEAIGKGNYDTPVVVRGSQDVLGVALSRMRENLKAARIRDNEQTAALQAEKQKLEQANERITVLIKEMHHRVKNNLQVIASLLRLQAGTIADERLQNAFDQSQSRVTSMALIHEKLYKGDELENLDVGLYIHELFSELVRVNDVSERIAYRTHIEKGLTFDLNTMVPLGLLLNELITNSFKHAFTGRENGQIKLTITDAKEGAYDLVYTDDGIGMPLAKMQPDGATLGVSLIESLVEQLNGRMTVEGSDKGTYYHIRFRTLGAK
ncbi:MAG TPA: histidine kinase dimerization/phosphoacceptor domain -containing protein [Flavobacteriales bacterium]|nr:histidine kinase dimerization/phosphoacceptor domain -containing protein [Flavobacteriales bacterium]